MSLITAKSLVKSYATGKETSLNVLKGVSVTIPEKQISVIIGASGAGKSTLLHILSGMDKPESGSVHFAGNDLTKLSSNSLAELRNSKFGFVFQFHHLLPEFTAVENVAIPGLIGGVKKTECFMRAKNLLIKFGLEQRINHRPSELSGGEQQRVSLARALVNSPAILFADEPTGNLDSANSELIHNYFLSLRDQEGITSVIVTHNKELIKLADNVIEMKDGMIIG